MKKVLLSILLIIVSCFYVSSTPITGTVVEDITNEPIIGANVIIIGNKMGTITDIDGNFVLNSTTKSAELQISYVGYNNYKVLWKEGKGKLSITLKKKASELDELVVIGYGVQKKSDLTGAISSIKAKDIQSMATSTVSQALQGKAAGVEVVRNSGAPGASTSIRIRGMGTVNNSEPLYVVDGISMDKIDYLSPDDIESIEVLKDASSAAIYGSRAANGVILVTTKSGKNSSKKFNINLSAYYGLQHAANTPNSMSQSEYACFSDYIQNQANMTELNASGKYVMNEASAKLAATCPNSWWDEVTRTAPMYKANISIFGEKEGFNYYISGNIQGTDGIIKESAYNRKSLNMKLNLKLSNSVNVGANLNYTREDKTIVNEGQWGIVKTAINYSPFVPIKDPVSGNYLWTTPYENLRRTTYDWSNNNLVGQLNLNWNIVKGLTFSTRASYTMSNSDIDQFNRSNSNDMAVGSNSYTVARNPITQSNLSWENILTYINKIGKHNFNVTVGHTMEMAKYTNNSASGKGYGGYDESFDALEFAQYNRIFSGYSEGANSLSFLGRASYDYAGKYLIQANFRADASSRFAAKNRWGFFPSVSAGWKINGENFLKDCEWISLLKLRLGWGQLGNNKIGNYAYMNMVSGTNEYIYGSGVPSINPAMSINKYGNPDIKWERTESYSAGVDFNLFNNSLTTSFDIFMKDTKDMLIAVPIVNMAGYPNIPLQNAGSVRNKGFEIQANYRNNIGDFRYEVGGNLTYVKNRVTSLGETGEPIYGGDLKNPNKLGYVNRTTVGAPIGGFYGWKTAGLMQESDFDTDGNSLVPTFASSRKFNPGDMKFVDINKDGLIDDNDKTYLGNAQPNMYYAFNINLGYKAFDLSLFFQGVAGNDIYNVTNYFLYSSVMYDGVWAAGNYSNSAKDFFDKVYRPANSTGKNYRDNWGPNTAGTVPAPSTDPTRNEMNFRNSDFYIEDGSYLRLKQIQLSYTMPTTLCKKTKYINGFKAYVTVTNPFTITKYSGMDPETGNSGNLFMSIDQGTYPQSRSYMLGVILDF
ncbi:MAG: TonB-dependent receptor [Muribaculaceae bacterium]